MADEQATLPLTDAAPAVVETKPAVAATPAADAKPAVDAKPAADAKPIVTPDAKPAEPKADAKPEPVDYAKAISEASLPEGFKLDANAVKPAAELFATMPNLSADNIKALTSFYAAQVKAGADSTAAAFQTQVQAWKTESGADKELGAENLGIAKAAASKVFDTKTVELMEHFGLMNHPGVLKGLVRVGKAIKDDAFLHGDAGGANGSTDARRHFPNSEMNP